MRSFAFRFLCLSIIAAVVAAAAGGGGAAVPARADETPDARKLVEAVKAHRPPGERRELVMKLTSKRGRVSERKLQILSFRDGAKEYVLIRFREPPNVARLGLLTVQEPGEDDEQHLYLPTVKKAKRIASSDRTGAFAGTDFAYEDLRVEDLERHDYRVVGEETVQREPCWKVEALPKGDEKEESAYARRELLISKARPVLLESRAYARDGGALVKVFRLSDYRKVGAFERPHRVEVENVAASTQTVAEATSWVADPSLTAADFTVFKLERGN